MTTSNDLFAPFEVFGEPGEVPRGFYAEIVSFTAAEAINPGRAVELADASGVTIRQVQSTGDTCSPVGIAIRHRRHAGYNIGDTVPVLMRGRIFAAWLGRSQPTVGGSLNVYHSSTCATDRGEFTDAALSVLAGVEVSAAGPRVRVARQGWAGGEVVLVDVSY